MSQRVYVSGVGMIPFAKPGTSASYDQMGATASRLALADAGIAYDDIEQAYVGYVYGDSTAGQKALYHVGMSGIPIINVNNNCSTGSTALFLARQAIASGAAECVLVLGFEQMSPGALGSIFQDRPSPFDLESFAKIRAKASRHAANNPLALFKQVVTPEDVMNSTMIWPGVMTKLMACPPTCGAAAAVLVSEAFAKKHGLNTQVYIAGQAMTTDKPSTFDSEDMMKVVGYDMSKEAAAKVYAQTGIGPDDLHVVELHDCFAHNELITYEALGLCPEGGAAKFIDDGDNTYGGKVVTNPSGGLLSKGHPLGATGLAQCFELTQQLRGNAGDRQVNGARIALQHNLGLGGACVVTMYRQS